MKRFRTRLTIPLLAILFLSMAAACSSASSANDTKTSAAKYPAKGSTIQIFCGFSAGGGSDIWVRILADKMSKLTGAKFQVVNIPGASGALAFNKMINSPKDGTRLASINLPSALQYLNPKADVSYNKEDFALIGSTGFTPNLIAVSKDSPYKTFQDLLDDMKAHPGKKLNTVADGIYSDDAISFAQIKEALGVDFNTVIVDGTPEKITAVLGHRAAFMEGATASLIPQLQSGQLRGLVLFADKRSPFTPDIPTAAELGFHVPNADSRYGITFAAGTPENVRQSIEDLMSKISKDKDYVERNAKSGLDVQFITGEKFTQEWDRKAAEIQAVMNKLS